MSLVGIIANPASGKDIRRLVAHGSVFDNQEKVRIVRRVLLGLAATGVERICYMPDYFGIVERALFRLEIPAAVFPANFRRTNSQEDATRSARIMAERGAGCLVTVGGDGTNRAVSKGAGSVPILPISTGTNNVFPSMVEGTLAGLAAGLVARDLVPLEESTFRTTKLEVILEGRVRDQALVDIAVYDDRFVASRAVWDMEKIRQIFLSRAEPSSIGLSSIGGLIYPVRAEEPLGLSLNLGSGGKTVKAPVAPGMVSGVRVTGASLMRPARELKVPHTPSVLALDGEREIELRPGQDAGIRLQTNGPLVVDVRRTMAHAAGKGILAPEITIENSEYGIQESAKPPTPGA